MPTEHLDNSTQDNRTGGGVYVHGHGCRRCRCDMNLVLDADSAILLPHCCVVATGFYLRLVMVLDWAFTV